MDLTNILNTREGATAQVQKTPFLSSTRDQAASSPGHSEYTSETNSPQSSVSPSLSEHSAYSRSGLAPIPSMNGAYSMAAGSMQHQHQQHQIEVMSARGPGRPSSGDPSSKAFPCSSCGKGFARRSDLARHERIHSGIRPHVCDYPGCEKQFIQRSALTVHARVHTGEKPHMCETCGKPFSDSSSLARHRRIHSGKRPYKCPYADCQKTFTRRTTLTRHQNHHTGTISEAAAATAKALAARPTMPRAGRPPRSPVGHDSQPSSAQSTPSPAQRSISLSPGADLPQPFPRHSEYIYRPNGVTSHPVTLLTREIGPLTPGPTPITTPTMAPGLGRPHPTSNPSYHAPLTLTTQGPLPPILEPTPKSEFQRSSSPHISGSPHMSSSPHMSRGSPHMSSVGYHSPDFPTSVTPTDDQFYFPPPPATSFQAQSASPEPGSHFGDGDLHKQRSIELMNPYETLERKVSTTA